MRFLLILFLVPFVLNAAQTNVQDNLLIRGNLQYTGGSVGNNKLLSSDASGNFNPKSTADLTLDWWKGRDEALKKYYEYKTVTTAGSPLGSIVTVNPLPSGGTFGFTNNFFTTEGAITNIYQPGFYTQAILDPTPVDVNDIGGHELVFSHSSTNWAFSYQSNPGSTYFYRVMMNGKQLVAPVLVSSATQTNWLSFVGFNDGQIQRDYRIQFSPAAIVGSVYVAESNIILRPFKSGNNQRKLWCVSDSNGGGYGTANQPFFGMVRQFGYSLGLNTFNIACGSSGYAAPGNDLPFINRFIRDVQPRMRDRDVVMFFSGGSDAALGLTSFQIQTNCAAAVTYVRSVFTNSTVIVAGVPTASDTVIAFHDTFNTGVSNAAASTGALFIPTRWFPISQLPFLTNVTTSVDGHYNQIGQDQFTVQALQGLADAIDNR